jgi:proteasome lid subunit RPN8/RPN11
MAIRLSTADRASIRRHGETAYPDECCGFLLGRDASSPRQVVRLEPAENAREDSARRRRFLIPPERFLLVERAARAEGLAIVGFYHSHPDAPARPSDFDTEHAWPLYSYLIVSVLGGRAESLSSWRLAEDRSGFAEEAVLVQDEDK